MLSLTAFLKRRNCLDPVSRCCICICFSWSPEPFGRRWSEMQDVPFHYLTTRRYTNPRLPCLTLL